MKTKHRKEKQTDSSSLLSTLAMLISLALSPDRGCSATPADQAWVKWCDTNVTKPQCTECIYGRSYFPGPEKYKKMS